MTKTTIDTRLNSAFQKNASRQNGWIALGILIIFIFSLGVASPMPQDELRKYVEKKIKRNDQALRIRSKLLGLQGAKFLAGSPLLQNVKTLVLFDTGLGDKGTQVLVESKILKNLISLNLGGNNIGDEGAKKIAHSSNLTNLEALDLYRNQIGNAGASALANSNNLKNLKTLFLNFRF